MTLKRSKLQVQSVSTVGVERVFLGGTLDPLLLDLDLDQGQDQDLDLDPDLDACLLTSDWGRENEETVGVGALWDVGGALGGEADVEDAYQDDGFHDVVVEVSLVCSAEEGGCVAGHSKGHQRVSMGE